VDTRVRSKSDLAGLAVLVESAHGWDALALSSENLGVLREICAHARQRKLVKKLWGVSRDLEPRGLRVLLSGPSGPGRAMSASVMARELGLDLYRVDLSRVVSKYIGETEKNIDRLFEDAEASGAALLFDEADALFGKRSEVKDSHDRYASVGAHLLQRLEDYRGLAFLATDRLNELGEAFLRRLHFSVSL
jgi:SpoVK/Ycf46/Vps4 family AAA+-type ATPase